MDFIYFLSFWGLLIAVVGIWAIIKSNQLEKEEMQQSL